VHGLETDKDSAESLNETLKWFGKCLKGIVAIILTALETIDVTTDTRSRVIEEKLIWEENVEEQ